MADSDLSIYLSVYLSKKSRLRRRKCRSTTRAPNNVADAVDDVLSYRLRIEALLLKEEFNQTVDWLKPSIDAVIISARGSTVRPNCAVIYLASRSFTTSRISSYISAAA